MATRISGEQQQPKWTAFLTKLLANLIVDQVLKGNRVNNSFSNKAWNFITDEFYKRSGFKWDKEHLKNRFAVLRRQYAVVKLLLARDDFIFDESNGSVIATDEAWDQYVKVLSFFFFFSMLCLHFYSFNICFADLIGPKIRSIQTQRP